MKKKKKKKNTFSGTTWNDGTRRVQVYTLHTIHDSCSYSVSF